MENKAQGHAQRGRWFEFVLGRSKTWWALGVVAAPWAFGCSSEGVAVDSTQTTAPAAVVPGARLEPVSKLAQIPQAPVEHLALERETPAVHYDISPPFRDLPPAEAGPATVHIQGLPGRALAQPNPGVLPELHRESPPTIRTLSLSTVATFEGMGAGMAGFISAGTPPDPEGAVGPTQYVQMVNSSVTVFNKSGTISFGPVRTNSLWSGFGGSCELRNDGDGLVLYDRLANRWVISQFTNAPPYLECVAVSTTGDAGGSYARYAYDRPSFGDYPKMGVWPDGYYATFNLFTQPVGGSYQGTEMCAFDRTKMLAGQASTQQCFRPTGSYFSTLPGDLDSATPPPAGAPNPLVVYESPATLRFFKFHVDFANPSNSTLTGPVELPVNSFTPACTSCIPQPNETSQIDSLADNTMQRASYRNFGDHDALVINHTIASSGSTGVRWYEVRDPTGTPSIFQQGTIAPDSDYRFNGSAALNGLGSIAVGYSVSSTTTFPSLRASGRLASDPLGTMAQGEVNIWSGTGSQVFTGQTLGRWGDYSDLTVDPVDDCTYWYTNEYLVAGSNSWHTRIGRFTVGTCPAPANQAPTVNAGSDQSITLPQNSITATGTASDDGFPVPPGTLTFTWSVVSGPGTVTFTTPNALTTSATFSQAGTYVLQLSASDGALTTSDTITVVVNAPPTPCGGICSNPVNFTIPPNGSFQSGNIGTGAVCRQTTSVVHGGNCGNFVFPRGLTVNGVSRPCTGANWATVPPARNGGYCISTTPGNQSYAFITAW